MLKWLQFNQFIIWLFSLLRITVKRLFIRSLLSVSTQSLSKSKQRYFLNLTQGIKWCSPNPTCCCQTNSDRPLWWFTPCFLFCAPNAGNYSSFPTYWRGEGKLNTHLTAWIPKALGHSCTLYLKVHITYSPLQGSTHHLSTLLFDCGAWTHHTVSPTAK